MIEKIKEYLETCPYLIGTGKVEYLSNELNAYSLNEDAGYEPLIEEDITGVQKKQFRFNLDMQLNWNDESNTNIDNSKLFENIKSWLEIQNKLANYPLIEGIDIESIKANTNGYIYMTDSNIAIYRISFLMTYFQELEESSSV